MTDEWPPADARMTSGMSVRPGYPGPTYWGTLTHITRTRSHPVTGWPVQPTTTACAARWGHAWSPGQRCVSVKCQDSFYFFFVKCNCANILEGIIGLNRICIHTYLVLDKKNTNVVTHASMSSFLSIILNYKRLCPSVCVSVTSCYLTIVDLNI